MDLDAVHALLRPLAGDAMVNFDQEPILEVNGPFQMLRLEGKDYAIKLFTEVNFEAPLKAQPKEVSVKTEEILVSSPEF